jgi:drug/metabolite transporter (DMT)-like permease
VTSSAASVPSSPRGVADPLAGGAAVWANLAAVYLIWGSTYLAIRVLVRTVPPLYGAGSRFIVAGLLMLAFLGPRRALRIGRRELLSCALVGTLLAAGGNGLVTVAEQDVPSGLAAVLIASVPLWIVVYRAAARDRVPRATLLGVLAGFAGVALLLLPGNRPSGVPLVPALVIVGAAASWGFGSFISQALPLPRDGLVTTGWQMLFGGIVLTLGGAIAGEHVGTPSGESAWAWAYLVVIGSLVAFTSYTWLLRNAPIAQVSTYAYVNPVVAVILGAVILGEGVGLVTVLGTGVIVASVATIVRRRT